jgi:putative membrane protein
VDSMGGAWMIPMVLGMVAFWGALIWFGVWAIRRFTNRPRGSGFRTLEDRFARGEIDEQEFETRRRVLES